MPHHNIKERQTKHQCIYCGRFFDRGRWVSRHDINFHYKTIKCKCGKETRITVKFIGSGHDNWDKKGWISIKEFEKLLVDVAKGNNGEKIEEKIKKNYKGSTASS